MPRSRIRRLAVLAALLAAALPATAAARPADAVPARAAKPTITINGSTSIHPLTDKLVRAYLKKYPGSVKFRVFQGGSDVGINDVARGRVSIGASSRDLQDGDPGGLQFSKVARDGVCVVTNTSNRLTDISQRQVQDIFAGNVRRWEDVPGAGVDGPIDLIVRTQASGTQDAFQNIFMGPSVRVAPSASQKASNGLVRQAVGSDDNAIGYVDMTFLEGIHAVPYKGVPCTLRNAKSGQYPGMRNFWYVTRGAPRGAVKKFINWVTKSRTAQNEIVASKWVPIR